MRVEKGKAGIGCVWFNSSPLGFHQLCGQVVLVESYREKHLSVIGALTTEFRNELQGSSLLSQ